MPCETLRLLLVAPFLLKLVMFQQNNNNFIQTCWFMPSSFDYLNKLNKAFLQLISFELLNILQT